MEGGVAMVLDFAELWKTNFYYSILQHQKKTTQIKSPPSWRLKQKQQTTKQQIQNNPPKNHHNWKNYASSKLGCLLFNSDLGSVYGKYSLASSISFTCKFV